MYDHETIELNRRSWDTISSRYQASTRISTRDVHYGPLAPGERELGLLGDVAGKRVIEIGCGGGQNSIALARWGAECVGVDPSSAQLSHARQLARDSGVEVAFAVGVAEDLSGFPTESFDLALSSFAFGYVTNLPRAYAEVWRVLRGPDPTLGHPGGLFVFCLTHPWFRAVGRHLAGDPDMPAVLDYAGWPCVDEWDWSYDDGTSVRMREYLHTVAGLVNGLIEAGFVLERLVEQSIADVAHWPPAQLDRLPYVDELDPNGQEYQVMRKLPPTLILRARKTAARYSEPARAPRTGAEGIQAL